MPVLNRRSRAARKIAVATLPAAGVAVFAPTAAVYEFVDSRCS